MSLVTAEIVYREFTQLTSNERAKFFALLAGPGGHEENFSHDQVFAHLEMMRSRPLKRRNIWRF